MVLSVAVDDGGIASFDSDEGFKEFLTFLEESGDDGRTHGDEKEADEGFTEFLTFVEEPSDVSITHGDEKEEETIEEYNKGSSYEEQTCEAVAKTAAIGLVHSRSSRFEEFVDSIGFVMKIGLVLGISGYFYHGVLNASDYFIVPGEVGFSSSFKKFSEVAALQDIGLKYPHPEPLIQSDEMIDLIKIVKSAAIGLAYSSLQTPVRRNGTIAAETGAGDLLSSTEVNEPNYLVAPGNSAKLTESAVLEKIGLKYPSPEPLIQAEPETIGLVMRVKSAATKMIERSPEPLIQAEPETIGLFKLVKSEATKMMERRTEKIRLNRKRLSNIVPFLNKRSLNKDDGAANSRNMSEPELKPEYIKSNSNFMLFAAIGVAYYSTILLCIMLGL